MDSQPNRAAGSKSTALPPMVRSSESACWSQTAVFRRKQVNEGSRFQSCGCAARHGALATILLVEDDPLVRELIAMEIGKAKARRGGARRGEA